MKYLQDVDFNIGKKMFVFPSVSYNWIVSQKSPKNQ